MIPNYKKIEILKAVLNGSTLSEAGSKIGVSATRARQLLARLCRDLKMPNSLEHIQSNKNEYLEKVKELERTPKIGLRNPLIKQMVAVLNIKNETDLTPQYLSNITASQLLENGITVVAICEIQEWLKKTDKSLKPAPPRNDVDIKYVKQAITVLDVFQFDAAIPKSQLSHFESEN